MHTSSPNPLRHPNAPSCGKTPKSAEKARVGDSPGSRAARVRRCNHTLLTAQIHDGGFAAVRYRGRWELYTVVDGLELFVRHADAGEAAQLDTIVAREAA